MTEAAPIPLHLNGSMPLPSSMDAPHFDGSNLREFLTNYEIAAQEAGWSQEQMCRRLPLYASTKHRDLLDALDEVTTGTNWEALKSKIKEYYHETRHPRYSRQDLEAFVLFGRENTIQTRKQFAEYNREFKLRIQYFKPAGTLTAAEQNTYFWQGLPKRLKYDIFIELKTATPGLSLTEAQPIAVIREAALKILNRDSLYATLSQARSPALPHDPEEEEDQLEEYLEYQRYRERRGLQSTLPADSFKKLIRDKPQMDRKPPMQPPVNPFANFKAPGRKYPFTPAPEKDEDDIYSAMDIDPPTFSHQAHHTRSGNSAEMDILAESMRKLSVQMAALTKQTAPRPNVHIRSGAAQPPNTTDPKLSYWNRCWFCHVI